MTEIILVHPQSPPPADHHPEAHVLPSPHARKYSRRGDPVRIRAWTPGEWAALPPHARPTDARWHDEGAWMVLRLG